MMPSLPTLSSSSVKEIANTSEGFLTSNSKITFNPKIMQIVPNILFNSCIYDLSFLGKQNWNEKKFRICYINGICTSFNESRGTALHLSELAGGINVFGVYNPTFSLPGDLLRSIFLLLKKKSKAETLLHQLWDDFFSNNDEEKKCLLQICSSQGAIVVRNALLSYNPEFRKNIYVLGLAPAVHINPESCQGITSLQTICDPVPKLDLVGLCRFRKCVKFLSSHKEVTACIDHSPYSSSFIEEIQECFLNLFINTECLYKEKIKFRTNSLEISSNIRYQASSTLKYDCSRLTINAVLSPDISGAKFGPEIINQFEYFQYKSSRSHIGRIEQILVCLDKCYNLSINIYMLIHSSSLMFSGLTILAIIGSIDLASFIALQISQREQYHLSTFRKVSIITHKLSSMTKLCLEIILLSLPRILFAFSSFLFLTGRVTSGIVGCSLILIPPLKPMLFKTIAPCYTYKTSSEKLTPMSINLDAKLFVKAQQFTNTLKEILLSGMTFAGCTLLLLHTEFIENSETNSNSTLTTNFSNNNFTSPEIPTQNTFSYLGLACYSSLLATVTLTKTARLIQLFLRKSKKNIFSNFAHP